MIDCIKYLAPWLKNIYVTRRANSSNLRKPGVLTVFVELLNNEFIYLTLPQYIKYAKQKENNK